MFTDGWIDGMRWTGYPYCLLMFFKIRENIESVHIYIYPNCAINRDVFFLTPPPSKTQKVWNRHHYSNFWKPVFSQKSVTIIRTALLQKNHKNVIIICSVMIHIFFCFKSLFIKKSLLRVEYQRPCCIPDAPRGSTRYIPLAWPPNKIWLLRCALYFCLS